MTTDFAALLYDALPGLYRDQDTRGELRAFLRIAADPLAELYASINALHDDLYAATCRPELIRLVGSLIGAEVDAGAPERVQRAQVLDGIRSYRQKGTAEEMLRRAEQVTGWRVHTVDGSTRLARLPLIEDPDRDADRPVTMHVGDIDAIRRLGRVDDDAPYTVDLGSPRRVTDSGGRAHPDAHIFFCTPATVSAEPDPAAEAQTFADLAAALERAIPAATVPVITDTRRRRIDPAVLP